MSLVGQIVAGESATAAGRQAVLNVMQNRAAVNFGGYGTTIEAQATAPLQFSAYPHALGASDANTEAMVSAANAGTLGNIVPNSLNYANPSLVANPNSWVWTAQGSGQGVVIGGNTFWANDRGGSPGYDPSQLANTNAVPNGPNANANPGSTTTNPDGSVGGEIIPGSGITGTLSANPSGTGSTSTSGDTGQGTPVTQGLQQGTIDAITKWIGNIESSFGSGLKSALTAGENAVGTLFGGVENWFIRLGLIVLAVILIAIGLIVLLWDHGGKETAQQMAKVAAA